MSVIRIYRAISGEPSSVVFIHVTSGVGGSDLQNNLWKIIDRRKLIFSFCESMLEIDIRIRAW